ncbi:hypothetical protein [Niveibacterium umoris]|uniref:Uncharacterized protein n=1 Tax=Niveibacterium umoris TaxID=1193620 RepID=A0A840BL72_9RHOO|nr:hypothetical protein [Niveibacterium umoris]
MGRDVQRAAHSWIDQEILSGDLADRANDRIDLSVHEIQRDGFTIIGCRKGWLGCDKRSNHQPGHAAPDKV